MSKSLNLAGREEASFVPATYRSPKCSLTVLCHMRKAGLRKKNVVSLLEAYENGNQRLKTDKSVKERDSFCEVVLTSASSLSCCSCCSAALSFEPPLDEPFEEALCMLTRCEDSPFACIGLPTACAA